MKFKKVYKIKYFFLGFFSFFILFSLVFLLVGDKNKRYFYYSLVDNISKIKNLKNPLVKGQSHAYFSKECIPRSIEIIPNKSTLIIGHAYGKKKINNKDEFISPKISSFLEKNKLKIETVFFTGDLFYEPSLKKWEKLYSTYNHFFDIYITPGNHDVGYGQNVKRDLFFLFIKSRQPYPFPFSLSKEGFDIVVDDSSKKNSFLSDKNSQNNDDYADNLIILRHNVAVEELAFYSGQKLFLINKLTIEKNFNKIKNVFIISGNAGMQFKNERLACFRHKNITHIENGIGEFKNDNILLIHKGEIFKYEI